LFANIRKLPKVLSFIEWLNSLIADSNLFNHSIKRSLTFPLKSFFAKNFYRETFKEKVLFFFPDYCLWIFLKLL
jgi:hypothetical protein